MSEYVVIQVNEPGSEPFWTIQLVSSGQDFRGAHRFISEHLAEEMADLMNKEAAKKAAR